MGGLYATCQYIHTYSTFLSALATLTRAYITFLQKIITHDMTNGKHEKHSVYSTLARNRAYLTAKDTDFSLRYYLVYVSFSSLSYGD